MEQENGILSNITLEDSKLTPDEKTRVELLLTEWEGVFSTNDLDVGFTNAVKHSIRLNDNTPFKQKHRRIPPAMYNEVRRHINQLLDIGVIRRSRSPWASNIVLVRKTTS